MKIRLLSKPNTITATYLYADDRLIINMNVDTFRNVTCDNPSEKTLEILNRRGILYEVIEGDDK